MYCWFLLVVRPVSRLLMGVAVLGREHLRFDRPAIVVANHNSHLDAAVLMDLVPLRDLPKLRPVAAADYFERGWWGVRNFIWRRCMNVVPIRRDKVTRTHNPLQSMLDALDAGQSILIFPEGTRGEPERLGKFQTGIAHVLAKRPDVPVIPVLMRNLGFSLPRGERILVPMFCDVFIGPPRLIGGGSEGRISRDEMMARLTEAFAELTALADSHRSSVVPEDDR